MDGDRGDPAELVKKNATQIMIFLPRSQINLSGRKIIISFSFVVPLLRLPLGLVLSVRFCTWQWPVYWRVLYFSCIVYSCSFMKKNRACIVYSLTKSCMYRVLGKKEKTRKYFNYWFTLYKSKPILTRIPRFPAFIPFLLFEERNPHKLNKQESQEI